MQTLFFDFDGTLVDSETFHATNWSNYLASYGVELSPETYLQYHAGVTWPHVAQHFIQTYNLPVSENRVLADMEAITETVIRREGIPAMAGVADLLKMLAGKVPMSVVTGAPKDYVVQVLEHLGWLSLFDDVFSGYDVENNKPAPDIYLHACNVMGVKPESAIAIEDSKTGVTAALSANLPTVLVNPHQKSNDFGAMHCFDTMYDATPTLLKLFHLDSMFDINAQIS